MGQIVRARADVKSSSANLNDSQSWFNLESAARDRAENSNGTRCNSALTLSRNSRTPTHGHGAGGGMKAQDSARSPSGTWQGQIFIRGCPDERWTEFTTKAVDVSSEDTWHNMLSRTFSKSCLPRIVSGGKIMQVAHRIRDSGAERGSTVQAVWWGLKGGGRTDLSRDTTADHGRETRRKQPMHCIASTPAAECEMSSIVCGYEPCHV